MWSLTADVSLVLQHRVKSCTVYRYLLVSKAHTTNGQGSHSQPNRNWEHPVNSAPIRARIQEYFSEEQRRLAISLIDSQPKFHRLAKIVG